MPTNSADVSGVRVLGCSASVALMDLPEAEVRNAVDAIVGWPTVHSLMEKASHVLSF